MDLYFHFHFAKILSCKPLLTIYTKNPIMISHLNKQRALLETDLLRCMIYFIFENKTGLKPTKLNELTFCGRLCDYLQC